jgi:hypothetical protein
VSLKRSEGEIEHNLDDNDIKVSKENLKTVGIANPVGKWTKMVILNGGLMQRVAQLIQKEGDQKY